MERAQTSLWTVFPRETQVLIAAQNYLSQRARPVQRVLSFGCSLGDELASLKMLFPHAEVFGCDVDEHALKIAERTTAGFAEVFYSEASAILQRGPFDLITAFSSLCVHPRPADISTAFPFARFSEMVALLSDSLADEGCLALFNTAYFPQWTAAGSRLARVRSDLICRNGFVNLFDDSGQLIVEAAMSPSGQAVRGARAEAGITDYDLIDCLFAKTSTASLIQLPPTLTARQAPTFSWERSELDGFDAAERSRWIEYRRAYRALGEGALRYEFDVYVQRLDKTGYEIVASYGPFEARAGDRL